MFKEKQNTQTFEEEKNEEEKYSIENLTERIKMKIEIHGEDNKEGNRIIEINEELRDAIVVYIYNNIEVKGLKKGEELLLYFYKKDLYLTALKGEHPHAWLVEDEEIINEIEELIM